MRPQRSLSMKSDGEQNMLPPLMEIPSLEDLGGKGKASRSASWSNVKIWMKDQLEKATQPLGCNVKRSDVQLLLGVLGSPLAPSPVGMQTLSQQVSMKESPISASSAQYIVHQYMAATGASSGKECKNFYAMGKVRMVASEFDVASSTVPSKVVRRRVNPARASEGGCFVLWQMMPDVWCVELSLAGCKVRAGSNGKLVWRHTPWMGTHRVKGPVRPLRRALQGLDPWTIGNMFVQARCIGEKSIGEQACFILKLVAGPETLQARSDGAAEIIRHVMFGYFSQKTGLLVHVEDTHLLRIRSHAGETVYWETSTETSLEDYREVEGVSIPHEGKTVSTLFRFGEVAMSHTRTRLEERWVMEEVAFNVAGVSSESFIPPSDLADGPTFSEASELTSEDASTGCALAAAASAAFGGAAGGRSKVAALDMISISSSAQIGHFNGFANLVTPPTN